MSGRSRQDDERRRGDDRSGANRDDARKADEERMRENREEARKAEDRRMRERSRKVLSKVLDRETKRSDNSLAAMTVDNDRMKAAGITHDRKESERRKDYFKEDQKSIDARYRAQKKMDMQEKKDKKEDEYQVARKARNIVYPMTTMFPNQKPADAKTIAEAKETMKKWNDANPNRKLQ